MRRLFMAAGLVLAWMTVSALCTPSVAAPNLLANPGFEASGGSYDGWFVFGGTLDMSLPAGDNIIRSGAAAAKVFGSFEGCPGPPTFGVGGFGQAFAPTAGMVYELSGYSFVSSADPMIGTDTCAENRMIAKIAFFNAAEGGTEISVNEIVIGDGNTPLDQWIPFSISAPAPAGALRVEALFLYFQPDCDAGAVFVDDTSFCELPAPTPGSNLLTNPSFDTDLTGWTIVGNVFHDTRAFGLRTAPGGAKMFSTFAVDTPSILTQSFPATPGSFWKLTAFAFTTCQEDPIYETNDNFVTAKIVFRDAGNAEIGASEVVILDNNSPLGTWTEHEVTGQAPAGTATVEAFILFISPSLLGGAAWVDDIAFWEATVSDAGVPRSTRAFELHQNAPNPFNPSTRIAFELARRDVVELSVFDVAGRQIATLLRGPRDAGPHVVTWDGRTASGIVAPAGTYRYVLKTSSGRTSRSMVLLK